MAESEAPNSETPAAQNQLEKIVPTEVSLVDNPAVPKATFAVVKRDSQKDKDELHDDPMEAEDESDRKHPQESKKAKAKEMDKRAEAIKCLVDARDEFDADSRALIDQLSKQVGLAKSEEAAGDDSIIDVEKLRQGAELISEALSPIRDLHSLLEKAATSADDEFVDDSASVSEGVTKSEPVENKMVEPQPAVEDKRTLLEKAADEFQKRLAARQGDQDSQLTAELMKRGQLLEAAYNEFQDFKQQVAHEMGQGD